MGHKIVPVNSGALLAAFIRVPWVIYRDDPNWVAQLKGEEFKLHNVHKHPFWKHARAQYFLAVDKGKLLGRIAAIIDPRFIEFQNRNTGYFGFFECIENQGVADSLFDAAAKWLKQQGVDDAIGPFNPSTNYVCGLLINGFDTPPMVMMPYNMKYYQHLIENAGLRKEKDLYAWIIDTPEIPPRLAKLADYAMRRGDFIVRKVDFTKLEQEVELLLKIYNSAWGKNWGFVPMTDDEFRHIAKDLKMIADKELVFIAEADGIPVGFSLALPDINQALIHNRSGRLLPFGIFKIMYFSKKIRQLRIITMGVIEGYRNKGIDIAFYYKTFDEGIKKGYVVGECSWVLEDNVPMNSVLEDIGARRYKTYRIYRLDLK